MSCYDKSTLTVPNHVQADWPVVPTILFLSLLEDDCDISFFQSSGISPDHHGLSKTISSSPAMRLANSLSSTECMCKFSLLKLSLAHSTSPLGST